MTPRPLDRQGCADPRPAPHRGRRAADPGRLRPAPDALSSSSRSSRRSRRPGPSLKGKKVVVLTHAVPGTQDDFRRSTATWPASCRRSSARRSRRSTLVDLDKVRAWVRRPPELVRPRRGRPGVRRRRRDLPRGRALPDPEPVQPRPVRGDVEDPHPGRRARPPQERPRPSRSPTSPRSRRSSTTTTATPSSPIRGPDPRRRRRQPLDLQEQVPRRSSPPKSPGTSSSTPPATTSRT